MRAPPPAVIVGRAFECLLLVFRAFWKQSLDRLQSENASTAADVEGGAGAAGQVSGEEDYENFFVFLLQSFLTLWFWVVSRLRATALLVGLRLGLTNARASPE